MTAHDSAEPNMHGKTVLVTGANSGLGKETAVALARQGASVVMLCRNEERAETALGEIRKRSGSDDITLVLGDLAEPDSVNAAAEEIRGILEKLDVLVNNAGVYLASKYENSRGWEQTWAVNHLGHFLLTHRVLDLLEASGSARVVTVSSMGHRAGIFDLDDPFYENKVFFSVRVYGDTKLANVLFTRELHRRYSDRGIRAYTLHPGMVATNLSYDDGGIFNVGARLVRPALLDAEEGADCQVWLASADDIREVPHRYYAFRKPRKPSRAARSDAKAAALWQWSRDLLELD